MPQQDASRSWLPSLGLVLALHVAVWWGMTHFKDETTRPLPLQVVNVALLPPPEQPKPLPLQPLPEPPKPRQQVQAERAPTPLPVLRTQAADAPALPAPPVEETRPTPVAAPPAPVARPAPEPVFEQPRYNAAYLSNPPPAYPLAARRRGIEGTALVRAEVSAEGMCLRAELKKSSGAEMLDQAALEAVRKWRFVAAKRGSQAVAAWVEVPIAFKLEN
jgi:protein TonB